MGYHAMAVSYDSFQPCDLAEHAAFAVSILEAIPWPEIPERRVMNLNLPAAPIKNCKGLKVCAHTTATWRDWYVERQDPRGTPYWWVDGEIPRDKVAPDTDRALLWEGWATLTPLAFSVTDKECIRVLQEKIMP